MIKQFKIKQTTIGLRHPRKDKNIISSQARRKAKALGGHCECFEKQALTSIIIDQKVKPKQRFHTDISHHEMISKKPIETANKVKQMD
ncbi:hypothetical protein BRARA_A00040 [Brassica rapa]|uniref:Uncharacterized protein n=1 Tax=Brassica campestris TaxID=3711 RepID=A0A398AH73_BRACM|nr:hypothetical protein BRARA_A00040 [Brassica rapa]